MYPICRLARGIASKIQPPVKGAARGGVPRAEAIVGDLAQRFRDRARPPFRKRRRLGPSRHRVSAVQHCFPEIRHRASEKEFCFPEIRHWVSETGSCLSDVRRGALALRPSSTASPTGGIPWSILPGRPSRASGALADEAGPAPPPGTI